jgi:hypothetical protein
VKRGKGTKRIKVKDIKPKRMLRSWKLVFKVDG